MSNTADVRSIDQMQALKERCEWARVQLLREVENLQVELRNLSAWLMGEVEAYWLTELRTASRVLREAKQALAQCESHVRESERRPCTEQRKQVARATERNALCERQVRLVREAQSVWERHTIQLNARLQRARDLAESDLPVAINRLDGLLLALETYAQIRVNKEPTK